MSLNTAGQDVRAIRRQRVAEILVRRPRVTQRQILDALTAEDFTNPQTGEPWSLGTVNSDVQAIRTEARERLARDASEWIARELDKLDELEKDSWGAREHDTVLRIMKRRSKLLGLDAPQRQEVRTEGSLDVELTFPDAPEE